MSRTPAIRNIVLRFDMRCAPDSAWDDDCADRAGSHQCQCAAGTAARSIAICRRHLRLLTVGGNSAAAARRAARFRLFFVRHWMTRLSRAPISPRVKPQVSATGSSFHHARLQPRSSVKIPIVAGRRSAGIFCMTHSPIAPGTTRPAEPMRNPVLPPSKN